MTHITLAPMEGVIDYLLRELLTELGGVDLCVTEFLRVTDTRLPRSVFYRLCPELKHGSQTRSGTPVHLQLLGNHPERLAWHAAKAAELGARGLDLNFGCPAKTVNRHKGGAVLLQDPELIHDIVKAVRKAVCDSVPITAKMRLGYLDDSLALDNAKAIEDAGASKLAVHARTKLQGYKPPAHWHSIRAIKEAVQIPVVANGDIFSVDDARRCQEITGCLHLMIGRGVLRNPGLPFAIARSLSPTSKASITSETSTLSLPWQQSLGILQRFTQKVVETADDQDAEHPYGINNPKRYLDGRLKQWLSIMSQSSEAAKCLFEQVKRENTLQGLSDRVFSAT